MNTPYLPLLIDLGPSKTYRSRDLSWVRATDPASEIDGTATISQRKSPGVREVDIYQIQEQQRPLPFAVEWREFLVLNVSDATQPDVYRVCIGPRGDTCTCRAGQFKLVCKHVTAIRAIIEEGGLDPLPPPAPKPAPACCTLCGEEMGSDDAGDTHPLCERSREMLASGDEYHQDFQAWLAWVREDMDRTEANLPELPRPQFRTKFFAPAQVG